MLPWLQDAAWQRIKAKQDDMDSKASSVSPSTHSWVGACWTWPSSFTTFPASLLSWAFLLHHLPPPPPHHAHTHRMKLPTLTMCLKLAAKRFAGLASFPDSQLLMLAWESESLGMRRLLWYVVAWSGNEVVMPSSFHSTGC